MMPTSKQCYNTHRLLLHVSFVEHKQSHCRKDIACKRTETFITREFPIKRYVGKRRYNTVEYGVREVYIYKSKRDTKHNDFRCHVQSLQQLPSDLHILHHCFKPLTGTNLVCAFSLSKRLAVVSEFVLRQNVYPMDLFFSFSSTSLITALFKWLEWLNKILRWKRCRLALLGSYK